MAKKSLKEQGLLKAAYPVIVLVVICCVAGAALGSVHGMTQPLIDEAKAESERKTFQTLIEGASDFVEEEASVEGVTKSVVATDASGKELGRIFIGEGKGYGGKVPVAVAVDGQGTVVGITVMANKETPGLGTKVTEGGYVDQYKGMPLAPLGADEVDLITGATISSKAVLAAFNACAEQYKEVS